MEFAESRGRAFNNSCYHNRSTTTPNNFTRVFLPISRETDFLKILKLLLYCIDSELSKYAL